MFFLPKNGIRRKVIQNTKLYTPKARQRINKSVDLVRSEMSAAMSHGLPILYLDEMMITRRSIMKLEYSNLLENMQVDF